MRKFIFVIAFVFSLTTNAQVRFSPTISADYGFGKTEQVEKYYGLNFVAGVDIGKRWNVGIGVGFEESDELYSRTYMNVNINYGKVHDYTYYNVPFVGAAQRIPVFARGKYKFLDSKVSPYVSLDLGAAITISANGDDDGTRFIARPAVGIDFCVGRGSIFLQLGYRNMEYKYEYTELTNTTDFKTQKSESCGVLELAAGYEF